MKMSQSETTPPLPSFDYELYEGDPDKLRTVVATPPSSTPWIDHSSLKLRHRIGRGPFGDVWLATHHQSGDDFDQHHEVAVKMLSSMKEEDVHMFLAKFEKLFFELREIPNLCWLHGISIVSDKICIVMKLYEGSIADRMARLKRGKLPLPDVLRYGINLAKAIQALHSRECLVLNLKPSSFFIDEHDQAILGDFGIPFLLLGASLSNSDEVIRLGTPNYMAPEQWEPEVRGPLTYETDVWGFCCSVLEMLTGVPPWFGKPVEEIYKLVVIKQEKPLIPGGLPPEIENVVNGCFEYDLRNRPTITDILQAFESCQNAVYSDGEWISLSTKERSDKPPHNNGYSTWFLSKDHLQVGDTVRSRKPRTMDIPEGTVVGLEKDTDRNGFVLVRIQGVHNPQKVKSSTLERVTHGLAVSDWVRLINATENHSTVGILHSIQRDGSVTVAFKGLATLWKGNSSELEMAEHFSLGQFVRLKENTVDAQWPRKCGKISKICPNGCLVLRFPGQLSFENEKGSVLADPDRVEKVCFDSCDSLVEKYRHVEDFHWAVRPVVMAVGAFVALKFGLFVGGKMNKKAKRNQMKQMDVQDHQPGGNNPAWLPQPVANIIFRENVPSAR
ncbi:serine/threonine-protein kinase DDB_G0283821 [Impatiens glandulifera]|uniref:serine/threonine-protein kinase DDB_G0283821 n=1 Tax=Impatiens glandulifera TaxID=253017 RepID=UPI001FB14D07|nr:serine/threonine-protein kinase DDB_G0283821 [Impatiens glandulifera]